ncbi:glycosyltransferase-like protein gnt13 isoform X2 [Mytilus trossulus]
MSIQKRNVDVEEIYGKHNDFGMKTRDEFSDIRISNRRKRWSIGNGNNGDHNSANGNQNIGNTNIKKSKHTNVIDARNERNLGRKRRLKICKKWSIGSNYTGDGNTADNNTNIDNKNKITNEIGVGNFEHSEQKSDWSIGSNNKGNKNSANGNTNICNNQKHSHKNTNVLKAGHVRNNGKESGWSYKRKRGRKINNRG